MSDRVYSVAELSRLIKELLDEDDRLRRLYVRGELSNYKVYPSGHHYFTIKDGEATLKAVMFRREASRLRFQPENGMQVVVLGRVTVYPRDGAYQLYAEEISPDGVGDLHMAYEQLKEKLRKEGLFEQSHKKPLPRYPARIAVITSSAGAAVRDVIRVATKRYPLAKLIVMPVRVQGAEAPPEIASAIRYANRYRVAELIITGRGGGSIEDLWAFNDERVARAIYESELPVISAVGHEPDVTISDFVADLRAATPSNAAELAVPERTELLAALIAFRKRMNGAALAALDRDRQRLARLAERRVLQSPGAYVDERRLALDHRAEALRAAAAAALAGRRARFSGLAASLDAMSPLKVLSRGYAIAEREDGSILRRRAEAAAGETLRLRISDGSIHCRVLPEDGPNTGRNDGKETGTQL